MIKFLYPEMFLLLLLPVLARWLSPAVKGMHGDALRIPFISDLANINVRSGSSWYTAPGKMRGFSYSFVVLCLIWIFLVMAAARPQWVGEPVRLRSEGRDIMLVMDISGSMQEPDFTLNKRRISRLDAVKLTASSFLRQRPNDRIGLVLFGTRAYLQSPVTFDKKSVEEILWSMEAGMAGNSTAIGDALGLALKNIRENNASGGKIIILLTDGENNDGSLSMSQAINLAKNEDVKIYTIGVGNRNALVNSFFGLSLPAMDGVDEQSLKKLADETEGNYFRATDTAGLQKIYNQIDKLEPESSEEQFVQESKDLFYIPLAVAVLLSILAVWLRRKGV